MKMSAVSLVTPDADETHTHTRKLNSLDNPVAIASSREEERRREEEREGEMGREDERWGERRRDEEREGERRRDGEALMEAAGTRDHVDAKEPAPGPELRVPVSGWAEEAEGNLLPQPLLGRARCLHTAARCCLLQTSVHAGENTSSKTLLCFWLFVDGAELKDSEYPGHAAHFSWHE